MIKFRGVRRVVETGLVLVAVTMLMATSVLVLMIFVTFVAMVRVVVIVGMPVTMIVLVFVMTPASVIVFSFLCHFPIPQLFPITLLLLPTAYFSRRLIRLWRSLLPFPLTLHS